MTDALAPPGVPRHALPQPHETVALGVAPPPARSGASTASAWLGVVGLAVCIVMPWGAIASVAAIIAGFAARPEDGYDRAQRLTGIVTGFVGLVFAAIWVAVVAGFLLTLAAGSA